MENTWGQTAGESLNNLYYTLSDQWAKLKAKLTSTILSRLYWNLCNWHTQVLSWNEAILSMIMSSNTWLMTLLTMDQFGLMNPKATLRNNIPIHKVKWLIQILKTVVFKVVYSVISPYRSEFIQLADPSYYSLWINRQLQNHVLFWQDQIISYHNI